MNAANLPELRAAEQSGYLSALRDVHEEVMRETRSTAKRVPTDWWERRGYRKGLRQAAALVEVLMEATK